MTDVITLYSVSFSPFAARCRIAIYAKQLDVRIIMPHADVGSVAFRQVNPTGKVPFLLSGSFRLTESEVICEYLEDRFPQPSLRPRTAEQIAQTRLLSRLADLYVVEPMFPIYPQLGTRPRDEPLVQGQLEKIRTGLGFLEQYLGGGRYAVADRLTLADCSLVPTFFYLDYIWKVLGRGNAWSAFPKLGSYWDNVQQDSSVARVLLEITEGLGAIGDQLHDHFLTGSGTSSPP